MTTGQPRLIMAKQAVIFISCGIFKKELEYLLREKGLDWKILYLEAALHVNFDRLKTALVEALEENHKEGAELKVLYGHCHPQIMEILERYDAKKIDAGNCLEAMVGAEEVMRLNQEGTAFFLSAGWVNNWEKMFALGRKDFNFDFKTMFDGYERIIVFDTGIIPIDAEKVERFSKFTKLPVERKPITLDYFFNLIEST
jgi:hypothetical protein